MLTLLFTVISSMTKVSTVNSS